MHEVCERFDQVRQVGQSVEISGVPMPKKRRRDEKLGVGANDYKIEVAGGILGHTIMTHNTQRFIVRPNRVNWANMYIVPIHTTERRFPSENLIKSNDEY